MLFDLRSRGRRTAVRIIYLFLALVMVAGLVLVGVGTGSNQGGLLNAFTNNGSGGGGGSSYADQQLKKAIKAAKNNPNSSTAWANLLKARYSVANSGSNLNTTTGAYSASGKKQLSDAIAAWNQYLKVTKNNPSPDASLYAARIFQNLQQWGNASTAWEFAATSSTTSSSVKNYLCMAYASFAAGNKSKGQLAAAKAITLTPKLQQLTLKASLDSAKSSATTAQQTLLENC